MTQCAIGFNAPWEYLEYLQPECDREKQENEMRRETQEVKLA